MFSAVHIAVHGERQISAVVHADDPHCMLIIPAPLVASFPVGKAEHLRQFIRFSVIEPEIPLLDKSGYRVILICHILDIVRCDAELYAVFIKHFPVSVKDPLHIAVVIEKVDRISAHSHPIKLFYIIILELALIIFTFNLVFCEQRGVNAVALLDAPLYIPGDLRIQLSPLDMGDIRVDVYRLVSSIITLFSRLQIRA